jgi:hypothetical protein
MRTGFNTEIKRGSTLYHVQTEDKGDVNPLIESLVYVGGQILDSARSSYDQALKDEEIDALLEKQHQGILKKIRSGAYEAAISSVSGRESTQSLQAQRGLDDLIVDYLSKDSQKAHLELSMNHGAEFVYGRETSVEVTACNDRTRKPMPGVSIFIKLISTAVSPTTLFEGKTDAEGRVMATVTVPVLEGGNAAVILKGTSELGSDELKQFVKRVKP